jgi:hypothetical protein
MSGQYCTGVDEVRMSGTEAPFLGLSHERSEREVLRFSALDDVVRGKPLSVQSS